MSEKLRRMTARWMRQRRKMLSLADDIEACDDVIEAAGTSPFHYRKIADEILAQVKHVRAGLPPPLPEAPYLNELIENADMAFAFEVAEFRRSQA